MAKTQSKMKAVEYDLNRPVIEKGSHPVETGDYQAPTNEIVNLLEAVCDWITDRVTGAVIYGRPRLGKTKMIEFMVKNIPVILEEELPIYHIVSLHPKIAKEEEFIETILCDMKHMFALTGKVAAKRQRLITFLEERGKSNRLRTVVLFIDEAQCLEYEHYTWLMDYYNKLERDKVTLILFLVGQAQLNAQKTIFQREHADQIVARFMIEEYPFSGIRTEEDIRAFLECYDERSEFPSESGWSFTRYYFPEAFATGERLANFAKEVKKIFETLRQKHSIKGKFEIPMHYMVRAVKTILVKHGYGSPNYCGWLSNADWENAIIRSQYVVSEQRGKGSEA